MILKKKLHPVIILTLLLGYIRVSNYIISQISGERLQDHWFSGHLSLIQPGPDHDSQYDETKTRTHRFS